jgi:hypothetical protein
MEPPRRHSIRLPGYDYAHPGAYFVTICTKGGENVFGEIVLDEFVIMPSHVHGIVLIKVGATGRSPLRSVEVVFPARSPLHRSPLRSGARGA